MLVDDAGGQVEYFQAAVGSALCGAMNTAIESRPRSDLPTRILDGLHSYFADNNIRLGNAMKLDPAVSVGPCAIVGAIAGTIAGTIVGAIMSAALRSRMTTLEPVTVALPTA